MTTYPKSPPVGLTSLDDTPLEVKSGEELPSGLETHESGQRDKEREQKDAQQRRPTCRDHPTCGRAFREPLLEVRFIRVFRVYRGG
jgi:hypothetical protein